MCSLAWLVPTQHFLTRFTLFCLTSFAWKQKLVRFMTCYIYDNGCTVWYQDDYEGVLTMEEEEDTHANEDAAPGRLLEEGGGSDSQEDDDTEDSEDCSEEDEEDDDDGDDSYDDGDNMFAFTTFLFW